MNSESYVKKGGEQLRRGFTTGSAAAGAAKAAVKMLYQQQQINEVKIDTPAGIELDLEIVEPEVSTSFAQAGIIKDGGDDPDVTDGLKIKAKAEKRANKIEIKGGSGVGKVTKPGLPVEIGQAAINPVPQKMIKTAVAEVLPKEAGVKITIEVPRGAKVAQKTLNPQLGITGGISILGTTGIVEPMSEQAYKDSLALAVDQAVAAGEKNLVLVFGNYGQRKAQELGFSNEQVIRMSNYVGFMLDKCSQQEIEQIILLGQIGKLVKVAAGIFNTHSQVADARLETIAAYTASLGANPDLITDILAANTSEEAVEMIYKAGYEEVFACLADKVVERAADYIDRQLQLEAVLFSLQRGVLGASNLELINGVKER